MTSQICPIPMFSRQKLLNLVLLDCYAINLSIYLQGGEPDAQLSTWTVKDVCDTLGRLDGLNHRNLALYQNALDENNISGMVLMYCDLIELKSVLNMGFGDWELFKAMVETFRDKEMQSVTDVRGPGYRSRHPSGGRIIEETPATSILKDFTTDKPMTTQNLEIPKAHYPKGSAPSGMVDETTNTGANLSTSLGAISHKSDPESERKSSQPGSIPGSPRKSRKSQDRVC